MQWWDDIWLNEGFSTFAMYQSLRNFHNKSQELEDRKKASVMLRDAAKDSHPVVQSVSGRKEIGRMFDRISYEKGASVINMIQYVMKEDFQTGLSNYLKKYAYGNAKTKDLWHELSTASKEHINITEVMDTWTGQMGFPYIQVYWDDHTFTARQQRYVEGIANFVNESLDSSPYGYVWKIPLTYKNMENGEEHAHWLNEKEGTFPLAASAGDCLKFNPGFMGYYIVNYDQKGWTLLSKKLQSNHEVFSATDRYSILFDAVLLAKEALLPYDTVLELTKYLKNEKSWNPWYVVSTDLLTQIDQRLRPNTEVYDLWTRYKADLVAPLYKDYRENEDMLSDFEDPEAIIFIACGCNLEACLLDQNEHLQEWLWNGSIPEDDTSFVALRYYGNESVWEEIWTRLTEENISSSDQVLMSHSLSLFYDKDLIMRSFERFSANKDLPPFTMYRFMINLRRSPVGLPILWDYVKDHWEEIMRKLSSVDLSSFKTLLNGIFSKFKTEEELQDVKKMLSIHSDVMPEEERKESYEIIGKNIKWLKTHEKVIENWLRQNVED